MLKSSLCDYDDAYIPVKETIPGNNSVVALDAANNANSKVILKNCATFTIWISEINNTQADNTKDIDIVMPIYNLIEYSDNYSETSGRLWQYCKDIPAVNNNNAIVDFTNAHITASFNFKAKMTSQTDVNRIKDVEIMVPIINSEVNLILNWSKDFLVPM